jgi:hypothetical protein
MDLANLIILALFVEAIVQQLKPIWDKQPQDHDRGDREHVLAS